MKDDDPFSAGNLTAEQTEAMFGGGVFEKKRDHKEIMLDVIAKSKKFKYERQKEKEEVSNAFEQLDANYKNILQMTSKFARNEDDKVHKPIYRKRFYMLYKLLKVYRVVGRTPITPVSEIFRNFFSMKIQGFTYLYRKMKDSL